MIPKINVADDVAGAKSSVTVWLPLNAFAPAHWSSEPPPVAVQLVAFDDVQVKVVDCSAVMVVGAAVSVAVTVAYAHTTAAP